MSQRQEDMREEDRKDSLCGFVARDSQSHLYIRVLRHSSCTAARLGQRDDDLHQTSQVIHRVSLQPDTSIQAVIQVEIQLGWTHPVLEATLRRRT